MKTLSIIGEIFRAITSAITRVVWHAARRSQGSRQQAGSDSHDHGLAGINAHSEAVHEQALIEEWSLAAVAQEDQSSNEEGHVTEERDALQRAEDEALREVEKAGVPAAFDDLLEPDVESPQEVGEKHIPAPRESERQPAVESLRKAEEAFVGTAVDSPREPEGESAREVNEELQATASHESERVAEDELHSEVGNVSVATAVDSPGVLEEESRREMAEGSPITAPHETDGGADVESRGEVDEGRVVKEVDGPEEVEEESHADEEQRSPVQQLSEGRTEFEAHHETKEALAATEAEALSTAQSETYRPALEDTSWPSDERDSAVPGQSEPTDLESPPMPARAPRQYRPVANVPTVPTGSRSRVTTSIPHETRNRATAIDVRLLVEKGGFCSVSLLPRRAQGMPREIAVSGSGNPPELIALQEEWYQDVVLSDLGRLLRDGVEWAAALTAGQQVRWSLSGRDLYVLAHNDELAGFVSVPRMILGEQHIVLCLQSRLAEVRTAIALTDSPEPALLDSQSGVPAGWVALLGVVPHTPVPPSATGDILDALRPLADVKIALEGGIRIERQSWLSGFPPGIRLRGDTGSIETVLVDGREASLNEKGGYTVDGWDSLGEHTVWCTADSRTYSIREGAENWAPWDAYRWSQGDAAAAGIESHPAICGVLVLPPRSARPGSRAILVPASNPVLIGAIPGEIDVCMPRADIRVGVCVGFPRFDPVWAVPADSLHCDKRLRVLLIGEPHPVVAASRRVTRERRAQDSKVHEWCAAIRAAGQKGLQTNPPRSDVADLWTAYKHRAKALWRSMR